MLKSLLIITILFETASVKIETATSTIASYRGLSLIGGSLVFDLVNTVKYRGAEDPQDKLQTYSDLLEWSLLAGLLDKVEIEQIADASNGNAILSEVLEIREDLWRAFNREHVSDREYRRAISNFEKRISGLRRNASIDPLTGVLTQFVKINAPCDLVSRLVDAIADVFSNRDTLRIKSCQGEDCDWLFIDRTKAGQRRWCDTKTCGNLARVRNFRKKHEQPERR